MGAYRGLSIEFSLPSSCYATMAIRELTRCDTTTWATEGLGGTPQQTQQTTSDDIALEGCQDVTE